MDYIPSPGPILSDDMATIRRTLVPYCLSCGRIFTSPELAWYVPIDGHVVCSECSRIHQDRQLRIYIKC
jgi:hypothetical protein